MNFIAAVAGNITVKTKRKSNLENDDFLLCFATSPFYYAILFETPQTRLDFDGHKNVFCSSKIVVIKIKWLSFLSLLSIYWK